MASIPISASLSGIGRRLLRRLPSLRGALLPVLDTTTPAWIIIGLALLVAILATWIMPYDPMEQFLLDRNQGISAAHWLGTDHLGRDVFSRLILGTRTSLIAGLGGLLSALFFGGFLGFVGSALGGVVGFLSFSFIDMIRTLPGILLALTLAVSLGTGLVPVTIALGLIFAPIFARIARAMYLREMASEYVTYSLVNGGSRLWVLRRHVLPNVLGAFVTQAGIILPRCIVTESVLSFLGLGVSPETPTWGGMIATASRFLEQNPVSVIAPVLTLSLVTLSIAVLSNKLRARTDALRATIR
jgi:peptide/nickel transport system permease protein